MVEDRIRAALREIVTASPVPFEERKPARRWPVVALAGIAVAAIVAVVALLPVWTGGGSRPVAAGGQPTLPEHFPAYAFGQGVLDGPFGRAIAMYHNGTGHEDWSFSQVIVAGADQNKYRRVPVPPVQRNGGIYARLTPDGTKVVVGAARGMITVIDLMTGGRKDYPTTTALFTAPRAVSADGRQVAFVAYPEYPEEGALYVLDLKSGQVSQPVGSDVRQVAFSPGGMLAYQIGQTVRVVESPGTVKYEFAVEGETVLAGPRSWTPDGRFLVTVHTGPDRIEGDIIHQGEQSYVFHPLDASTTPVPQPIPADDLRPRSWGDYVLGWRTPTVMLVSGGDVNGTTSNLIQEVDITSGSHRIISRFRVGPNDDLAVGDIQLATGLLAEMDMRSGGNPDRGPWPTWLIVTILLSFLPVTLTILVTRLRRR